MRFIIFSAVFLSAIMGVSFVFAQIPPPPISYSSPAFYPPPTGYSYGGSKPSAPPIPPVPDYLEDFNLDLDLNDFTERNQFPNQHCFFKVKGRKDVIEFNPDQQGGTFMFPTGLCNLDEQKCHIAERNLRFPKMKKTDPPAYAGPTNEAKYNNFPVIPYKYADDIDFSKCVPSWTGYFEVDNYKVSLYKTPKRDYSKQSCYHSSNDLITELKNRKAIFCDEEKCQFTKNQYCDNKTGQCYQNGYPLKTKKGQSVTTYENYWSTNWDFCMDENGTLIPDDGGPPYEERFEPGCSYNITAPNYHDKKYGNTTDFLVKCDENRCNLPGLDFDMKKKQYYFMNGDKMIYTNTPTLHEFPTIDWTCLDANRVPGFNKNLLCRLFSSDEKNPGCQLCYENKNFIYRGCTYPFDKLGIRADVPSELRNYDLVEQARLLRETILTFQNDGEISHGISAWFYAFIYAAETSGYTIDQPQRHRLAFKIAQFRGLTNPTEEDVEKLKKQILPFLTSAMEKEMNSSIKTSKNGSCMICRTSTPEARRSSPIRDACEICEDF